MKKIEIPSFYLIDRLENHNELKESLLELFNHNPVKENDSYKSTQYGDKVTNLDWSRSQDLNREWVKILLPHLQHKTKTMLEGVGYDEFDIIGIWFQQYYNSDIHDWHFHGATFTCVYYLELEETSPKTQLMEPYNINNIIEPEIKEGDILLFPAHIIHRGPTIPDNKRKTIVSYNVNGISLNV